MNRHLQFFCSACGADYLCDCTSDNAFAKWWIRWNGEDEPDSADDWLLNWMPKNYVIAGQSMKHTGFPEDFFMIGMA